MQSISLKRLAYFSLQVFSANILGGLLTFAQPIIILNLSGEATLGIFSLLVSWANIGLLLASFGILTAFQRLGARYYQRRSRLESEVYRHFNHWSLYHLAITSILLAVLASVVHFGEVPILLYPGIVVVLASLYFTRWFLVLARIRENNFWPNIFDQPLREGIFIGISLALWYLISSLDGGTNGKALGADALIILYSIAAVATGIVAGIYVHKNNLVPAAPGGMGVGLRNSEVSAFSLRRLRSIWLGIARTSFPSELGIYLIKRIDVIIVGALVSTETSGVYFLLSRIAELPNLIAGSINVIVGPEFAKMSSRGHESRKKILYLLAAAAPTFMTLIMIAVVYYAENTRLLDMVFGQSLDIHVLYIFLSGYLLYFALGPSTVLLTMTGGQKISSVVAVAIVIFHLFFVSLMTIWFAETGAALAFCLSIVLQRLIELAWLGRDSRIRSTKT